MSISRLRALWSGLLVAGLMAAALVASGAAPASAIDPVRAYPDLLQAGDTLHAGDSLVFGDARDSVLGASLYMQSDGNLVEYVDRRSGPRTTSASPGIVAPWSSGTSGNPGAYAILQFDGNFVIYSAGGAPLWSTGTAGAGPGTTLATQLDRNIVVYAPGNRPVWASGVQSLLPDRLAGPGQIWELGSTNGRYFFSVQGNTLQILDHGVDVQDGGLIIWEPPCPPNIGCEWSDTNPLQLQSDGNLVLYQPGTTLPVFQLGTAGVGPNVTLIMQNDGNLVLYGPHGPVWNSQTAGK